MPLLIPTSELQAGMRLLEPVRLAGLTLLAAGKVLTATDIAELERRYPDLAVQIADPLLDQLAEFEDDGRDRAVAEHVRHQITGAMREVQHRFSERASLKSVDFPRLQRVVAEMLEYLQVNSGSVALLSRVLGRENYLAHHTGNVFYLAMMLGAAMRDYVFTERQRQAAMKGADPRTFLDLTPLGLGAMFIDVGMLPVQEILTRPRPLTQEERALVREHPIVGAQLLPDNFSAVARSIVKTHHENFDGTGYPQALPGDRLQIFTRIVRIADAFSAATSSNQYREAKSAPRALWEMTVGPYARFYDPALLKVFGTLLQPFPIGARLRLTDGRSAVVVKYNRTNPFFPHVLIAFDRDGVHLPEAQITGPIALDACSGVRVASWGDEDLSYLYSDGSEHIVPRPAEFRTAFEACYP
ncbi:MAG: HD domain-containing protein [Phycisphaerales bacterium]|nr:HD domain-containing protein [Phycisphaerales bacterium]